MQATVIDPADIEGLESALEKNNVSIGENSLCIIILLEYAFPVDCLLKKVSTLLCRSLFSLLSLQLILS